jgi:uncharacterized membrane protein YczE
MKKIFYSLFFYLISAFGISLTIVANVGVSSFNSFNVAVSSLTSIKVGTVTTIVNLFFLVACIFLDKNRKIKNYLFILISLLMFGNVVNFFVYSLLGSLTLSSYLSRILLFILGTIIAGIGTGKVLYFEILKFPIENFCLILSQKTSISFQSYRYSIDVACVCFSLLFSVFFSLPIFVREGTAISLILLSSTISFSKNHLNFENYFTKH